jgi:type I restriction-modification system DNA methylase subunit
MVTIVATQLARAAARLQSTQYLAGLCLVARWPNLIARTSNIGEALDQAFAKIEEHNTELQHVLTTTQLVARHIPQWRSQHKVLEQALFGDAV